jgi:Lon protease-like protein
VVAELLGMFPLQTVLFPFAPIRLHVFEERYQVLMADCRRGGGTFGVVLISRGSEVGGGDHRVDVGTVAHIERTAELGGGRLLVEAVGTHRVQVDEWLPDDPYPQARVDTLAEADAGGTALSDARSAVVRLRSLLSELGDVPPISHDLALGTDAAEVGWRLCALAPLGPFDRQALLAASGTDERMTLLTAQCEAMAHDVSALLAGETEA